MPRTFITPTDTNLVTTDTNGWTCITFGNLTIATKLFSANIPALGAGTAATITVNSGNAPTTWTQAKQITITRSFQYEVGSSYQLPLTNENQGSGDNPTTPLVIVNRSGVSVGATTNGIAINQLVIYTV